MILLILVVTSLALFSCGPTEPPKKTKDRIRLQLKWTHQAQFAGYYLAVDKGFYRDENLDVTLIEGGSDIDQCGQLISDKADFAVTSGETVFLRQTSEHPLVALAVIYQRSAVVYAARKESSIVRPLDFRGKTIAVGNMASGGFVDALVQFQALIKKMGVREDSFKLVPYDPLYADFIAGKADVTPSYLTGGAIKLRGKGVNFNLIWPGDYGISFYSDTLVTSAKYLQKNQDTALRFLRATLKGWQYAIEHSEEAVDVTMQYVKVKDRNTQYEMHEAQIPLIHTGKDPIGWMRKEVWQSMYDLLVEQGLLQQPVADVNSVFTLDFLNKIYPPVEK